ncbi:hypothetical protein OAO87_00560 [bacterium]|nr:hypothetical protein [bacterium]
MGAAPSSLGCVLTLDDRWQPCVASLSFLHEKLPADAAVAILQRLDAEALISLSRVSQGLHAAGRAVGDAFDEACFKRLCEARGWTHEALSEVGIHLTARKFTPCPPWLGRLGERLSQPHQNHMRTGVVAKARARLDRFFSRTLSVRVPTARWLSGAQVFDAMGPLDAGRTRFLCHPPGHRRLFLAHVKHGVAPGSGLITQADLAQLRRLRSLSAYLYAEGWEETAPHVLEHTIEHALAGRIEP